MRVRVAYRERAGESIPRFSGGRCSTRVPGVPVGVVYGVVSVTGVIPGRSYVGSTDLWCMAGGMYGIRAWSTLGAQGETMTRTRVPVLTSYPGGKPVAVPLRGPVLYRVRRTGDLVTVTRYVATPHGVLTCRVGCFGATRVHGDVALLRRLRVFEVLGGQEATTAPLREVAARTARVPRVASYLRVVR